MKVVFVAPYALPLSVGGFQGQVYHIYKELKTLGVNVEWHSLEYNNLFDADILQVMSTEPAMLSMMRRAKMAGVKVVLTPMQGSRQKSNKYLKIALNLSKIPQLCTSHKLTAEIVRCADYLTPLCRFEADRMQSVYGVSKDKITVIPNGMQDKIMTGEAKFVDIPFNDYILMVGRVDPNKNQLSMIIAAKQLGKKLIIVGEPGSEGADYLNRCKKEATSDVYFWGLEKNPLVLKYLYQKAALTAIPSYSEMVPLVAFESLSQNTPVICTNRCGINGDDVPGLFFTDVTVDALKKTVTEAQCFDRKKISDKGVYTWNDIAKMYMNVYTKLLEK